MNKYESIKADMTTALKNGDKLRRVTLADMVATIDKTATAGKKRVEITDEFVNEVLIKYKKTVQEMVDTCPDNEKYADKKAEYLAKLAIAMEYAPKVIDNKEEIIEMINLFGTNQGVSITSQNKSVLMKMVMPWLKKEGCDMKVAQEAMKEAMVARDAAAAKALEV